MGVVTVQNTRYTADPLYQWNLNQILEIRGLSLASIPEIHFTNDNMSRAIVRQATMDAAGVITVDVPNSLLQTAGKLKVYVCTYERDTFQTLYKLEIVVKARAKPSDYTLEDDPEVYSFNALENYVYNQTSTAVATCSADTKKYYDETSKTVENYAEQVKNYSEQVDGYRNDAAKVLDILSITSADEGKFLRVVEGDLAWVTIVDVEGVPT